jgi:ribose 5-phosphate isomerase B
MQFLKIAIASDHAGYELKIKLVDYLMKKGYATNDLGSYSPEPVDYPDMGHLIAKKIATGEADIGISLCGTGNGISMTANKHPEIRSALCWTPEIAELARRHNNANICALPARFITFDFAVQIVEEFLQAPFDGGRHLRRIEKIPI